MILVRRRSSPARRSSEPHVRRVTLTITEPTSACSAARRDGASPSPCGAGCCSATQAASCSRRLTPLGVASPAMMLHSVAERDAPPAASALAAAASSAAASKTYVVGIGARRRRHTRAATQHATASAAATVAAAEAAGGTFTTDAADGRTASAGAAGGGGAANVSTVTRSNERAGRATRALLAARRYSRRRLAAMQ